MFKEMFNSISKIILTLFFLSSAYGVEDPATLPASVGLVQNIGREVNTSLQFTDQDGKKVTLASLLRENRPLLLIPVYYDCPRLCGLVLEGFTKSLENVNLRLGQDFAVAAVSFDPSESVEDAQRRAKQYRSKLLKDVGHEPNEWHFLLAEEDTRNQLLDSIGFRVKKEGQDFAHAATLVVMTPSGKVSRYFPGIEYSPRDLRLSLIEASAGRIGSVVDMLLMYCFRFDPAKGRYTWAVFGLLKLVGTLMLIGFGLFYWSVWNRS